MRKTLEWWKAQRKLGLAIQCLYLGGAIVFFGYGEYLAAFTGLVAAVLGFYGGYNVWEKKIEAENSKGEN